jgi:hypothetical protein
VEVVVWVLAVGWLVVGIVAIELVGLDKAAAAVVDMLVEVCLEGHGIVGLYSRQVDLADTAGLVSCACMAQEENL